MRMVNRNLVAAPASLSQDDPNSPAAQELEKARGHFMLPPPRKRKQFNFKAYKSQDVVESLEKLFHRKCAYCETKYGAAQPTDVEHFRPKGGVEGCQDHPGYWWLAARWDNILPSCIDCNRSRYHHVEQLPYDPLSSQRRGTRYRLGKGTSFPILGGAYVYDEHSDLGTEQEALIDPTRRDPADHLVWLDFDGRSLISPRRLDSVLDECGKHTYRVFGLNRQGLVEHRTALMNQIRARCAHIADLLGKSVSKTTSEETAMQFRELALGQLKELQDYAAPDAPYSAMAQEIISQETDGLIAKFGALET